MLAALAVVLAFSGCASAEAAAANSYASTLYLSNTASALVTGSWQLVTSAPSSADTSTGNRIAQNATGYQDFVPGVKPAGLVNSAVVRPPFDQQQGMDRRRLRWGELRGRDVDVPGEAARELEQHRDGVARSSACGR